MNKWEWEMPELILRVDKADYIDNLCSKGHMYMPLLKRVHDVSSTDKDGLIFDNNDGKGTDQILLGVSIPSVHEPNKFTVIANFANGYQKSGQCVYCTIGIRQSDFDNDRRWVLPWTTISQMFTTERTLANSKIFLLWNTRNFIDRWKNELTKKNIPKLCGFVEYDNNSFIPKFEPLSTAYAMECCFHKHERFAVLNEFRFVARSSEEADISDIYIGKLNKDSYCVIDINDGKDFVLVKQKNENVITYFTIA